MSDSILIGLELTFSTLLLNLEDLELVFIPVMVSLLDLTSCPIDDSKSDGLTNDLSLGGLPTVEEVLGLIVGSVKSLGPPSEDALFLCGRL